MNAKRSLLEKIKDGSFALLTDGEISKKLRLGRRESAAVREMLLSLCREGELLCDSRSRFGTAAQFHAVRGVFTGNERGFGFVTPEDGEDLFIPPRATGGALHGDTVLAARVFGRSCDEGEVLAVLSRGYTELVGTYRRADGGGYLRPDERKYAAEIFIPAGKQGRCTGGEKAVAKITSFKGPVGEITEILGSEGDLMAEERALIRAYKLRESFPEEVLSEAERVSRRPVAYALEGRLDLRGELIVTVDGEDTRDIDDAISVREEGGRYLLGVHIADVSEYVARGGALDREAFLRGTSVYFPDRVLPMLPTALSNGICSLNEGEDRLTLSCLMTVDGAGKVVSRKIVPSVIRSRRRMTYHEVDGILSGAPGPGGDGALSAMLLSAEKLMKILKRARDRRGGVDLDVREAKILYRDGKIAIPDYERTPSQDMIEQFMVLANESVARLMTERKVPFIYRVHEPPSEDKARQFAAFLSAAGVPAPFDPLRVTPKDYRDLLRSLGDSPLFSTVNRVMLRSMMKARYSPENAGHFGLASECYCHFTSPIRRYPDLSIHRIIKEALGSAAGLREKYGGFVRDASLRSSECERTATEAERDVDALYTAFYMRDRIGEIFEATVSGVTSFGLFAELKNTVEGVIPLETLPEDCYEYIEEQYTLRGLKNSYRLGDRLRVQVSAVDLGARRTHFVLLEKL